MDLLFGPTTATTTATTTPAPIVYGPLLEDGKVVEYRDEYGIASVIARDMTLALFVMMSSYRKIPEYPTALFYCDFESGWCPGFEQNVRGDIPWSLQKGRTPSNETGPDVDHTRFNEYGTYIYLEASKRRFGETAVFVTPSVLLLDKPYYCLSFWYNMYGRGMGSLWIHWNAAGIDGIHSVVQKHSGKESQNGSDWLHSTTTLSATSNQKFFRPVWFEFRGVRGISYKSDIAVDDILLTPGKCEEIPLPRTATTMTFRGITTQAPTTTPVSWKASHPDWNRCGDGYMHVKKHTCCNGVVRPKRGHLSQCCGKRLFNLFSNVCCRGHVLWVNSHGCCGGNRIYTKRKQDCCGSTTVYDVIKEKCVDNNKVVPRKIVNPPQIRGKREANAVSN